MVVVYALTARVRPCELITRDTYHASSGLHGWIELTEVMMHCERRGAAERAVGIYRGIRTLSSQLQAPQKQDTHLTMRGMGRTRPSDRRWKTEGKGLRPRDLESVEGAFRRWWQVAAGGGSGKQAPVRATRRVFKLGA